MINVGEKAPEIDLETQSGERWRLSERLGKKNVMIVFYPADWTPICSSELPEVNKLLPQLESADTEVVALSTDTKPSHQRWSETLGGISFAMLCDCWPRGEVCKNYDTLLEDHGVSDRATVIVGKDGVVRYAESVGVDGRRDFGNLVKKASDINGTPPPSPAAPAEAASCSVAAPTPRIKAAAAAIQVAKATLYLSNGCHHCRFVHDVLDNGDPIPGLLIKEVSDPEVKQEFLSVSPGGSVPALVMRDGTVIIGRDNVLKRLAEMTKPIAPANRAVGRQSLGSIRSR